jgi:hypothetical protein
VCVHVNMFFDYCVFCLMSISDARMQVAELVDWMADQQAIYLIFSHEINYPRITKCMSQNSNCSP